MLKCACCVIGLQRQLGGASHRPTGGGLAAPEAIPHSISAGSMASDAGRCSVGEQVEEYKAAAAEGDGDGGAGLVRLTCAWISASSPNTCLLELNLTGHALPHPTVVALSQMLRQHLRLRVLKVSDPFGLGEQQLQTLCPAVAAAPALQQLQLLRCGVGLGSRGPLGLDAARAIAGMMSGPGCHLTSLDLSFSCFQQDAEVAGAVWSVLAGAVRCTATGNLALAGAMLPLHPGHLTGCQQQQQQRSQQHSCGGCCLVHLSLAHCRITESGAAILAAALSSNFGLVSLDLSGLKHDVATVVFTDLLQRCNAAATAAQAPASQHPPPGKGLMAGMASPLTVGAHTVQGDPRTSAAGVGMCGMSSLKVTGQQYDVVDLLAPMRQQLLLQQSMQLQAEPDPLL